MKIEIKNRYNNSILFSYECENNTILKTLLKGLEKGANLHSAYLIDADLSGANLCGANLHSAYLIDADLSGTDLRGANLIDANLSNANLSNADLRGADLCGADLCGADLRGADLRGANLSNADLRGADFKNAIIPIYCKWNVSVINQEIIKIGCKKKTIKEWVEWFENSNEIFETKRDSDDFKKIRAMFYAHKAYIETLNN
jgi:hypothetical protein